MDGSRELRRMPRGERCPECGSQRWYLEDGLRFCSRGHQIEGFIQFDIGDMEDSGKTGTIARREKTVREQEKRVLTGKAGKSLFLEALQLLLRNQLSWLILEKGHKEELETVVRDLWDLRTRGFGSGAEDSKEDSLEMFSSQPDSSQSESTGPPRSRAQSWTSDRGSDWPMPGVRDTIALCYLGCCLLRIPTRMGQLLKWANDGHLPYRLAFQELPREMQDRMMPSHVKLLKAAIREPLSGISLYNSLGDLLSSLKKNYGMVFPEVNYMPMLVQYARLLALPIEPVIMAKRLISVLDLRFSLPAGDSRINVLSYPEIHLMALLLIGTRICFPFEGSPLNFYVDGQQALPAFDWASWHAAMEDASVPKGSALDLSNVKPGQVAVMTDDELKDYFEHVSSFIEKRNESKLTQFFPSDVATISDKQVKVITDAEVNERSMKTFAEALATQYGASSNVAEEKFKYDLYRSSDDLLPHAKAFYQASGNIAAISLERTVRAVKAVENVIISWQRGEWRNATEGLEETGAGEISKYYDDDDDDDDASVAPISP